MKINKTINIEVMYFLHLLIVFTSLYSMEEKTDNVIISYNQIKTRPNTIIKDATHYIYILEKHKVTGCNLGYYAVSFYKNELNSLKKSIPIITIYIALKPQWAEWTPEHKNYCNNFLDTSNTMTPNFLQIKKNKSDNKHSLYLYCDNTLMNIHDFEVPEQSERHKDACNFMDVKNTFNPCIYYFQPQSFYSNVNQIQYFNGHDRLEKFVSYTLPHPLATSDAYIFDIEDFHHEDVEEITDDKISHNQNILMPTEVNNMYTNKVIFLKEIKQKPSQYIQGAIYYTFLHSSTRVAKTDVLIQAGKKYPDRSSLPTISTVIVNFYTQNNQLKSIAKIEFEVDKDSDLYNNQHEEYCNSLLDPNINLIVPNRIEIKYDRVMWPWLNLYNDQKLIGSHHFDDFFSQASGIHFMDLKNPNHSFKKMIRPHTIFYEIKDVSYHNGFYLCLTGTYDKSNNLVLKYTWQHIVVLSSTAGLIALLLHYVSLKSGLYKLILNR